MRIHTETLHVEAPAKAVFDLVTDIPRTPQWAVNFVKEVEAHDGGYVASTPLGKLPYHVRADRDSGVMDLVVGEAVFPTRVVDLGRAGSAFVFTIPFPPGTPEAEVEAGIRGLQEEMGILKRLVEA